MSVCFVSSITKPRGTLMGVGGDLVFEGNLDMGVNVCAGLGCAYLAWFGHCGGFGVTFEVGGVFVF